MVLVFALQKLSTVTASTEMREKMPVVSGLGEQFQWANLQFDLMGGGDAAGGVNGTNSTNSTNSTNGMLLDTAAAGAAMAVGAAARARRMLSMDEHWRSLDRGAKGLHTLLRVGSKRVRRWDEARRQRNESAYEQ